MNTKRNIESSNLESIFLDEERQYDNTSCKYDYNRRWDIAAYVRCPATRQFTAGNHDHNVGRSSENGNR